MPVKTKQQQQTNTILWKSSQNRNFTQTILYICMTEPRFIYATADLKSVLPFTLLLKDLNFVLLSSLFLTSVIVSHCRCTHCIFSPRRHRQAQERDGHIGLFLKCIPGLVPCRQPSHLKHSGTNPLSLSDQLWSYHGFVT